MIPVFNLHQSTIASAIFWRRLFIRGTSKYSFAAILHCLLPQLFGSNAQQNPLRLALFAFNLQQNPTQSCVPLVFRGALKLHVVAVFAVIIFLTLFFSCAGSADFVRQSAANSIADLTPNWQTVSDGIEFSAHKIKMPHLRVYALKIDLQNPEIQIVVNSAENKTNIISSTKVSSFAKKYDCVAAINCGPFYPVSTKENENRNVVGVFISNGVLVSSHSIYDAIVFYKNGNVKFLYGSSFEYERQSVSNLMLRYDDIENAIGGFYIFLQGGQFVQNNAADKNRHPRSVAGLSADNKTLYLAAIDGRQLGSVGATLEDAAWIMKILGADTALNFDGGGSTALALKVNGKIKIVNKPVHNMIPGTERAVATCIGVRASIEH